MVARTDQSMRVRKFFRTRVLAGGLATLAVLITPVVLFAHARLVRSVPPADGWVNVPPTAIKLWFSEAPELRFTTVSLLDSAAVAISLGSVEAIPNEPTGVSAFVTAPMGVGKYTVVWRTAAADGHATSGRFDFIVTRAPSPPVVPGVAGSAPTNARAVTSEPPQSGTVRAIRWLELVAVLTLIGALVFRLFVLGEAGWAANLVEDSAARACRLALAALVVFIVASLIRLVIQSDLIPNAANARIAAIMATARQTRWGRGWTTGAGSAIVTLAGLLAVRASPVGWIVAALGTVGICLGQALTGHAGVVPRHSSVAVAADLAHFLGAGGWLGGLAAVLRCGLPALADLDEQRARRNGSALIRAYHRAAMECVALVALTALIALWVRLNAVSDLWTTGYGRIVLLKFSIVALLLGFGWHHWRKVVAPDWDAQTASRFQRTAAAELLVGAVVAAVTAVLVATALPR
jgi:copper transport protein